TVAATAAMRRSEQRAAAVDQQGAQVAVTALADAAEAANGSAGTLARSETEPACQVAARGEAQDVAHCGHQGRRGQQADARDAAQQGDDMQFAGESRQFVFGLLHPRLQVADLIASLLQEWVKRDGQRRGDLAEQSLYRGSDPAGTTRNVEAELAQDPPYGVDAGGAAGQPRRAQSVQRQQRLLLFALDRHGCELSAARCLE